MNENLENLKQKIGQLGADERWNDVISLCTEVIDSDQEPHAKAIAYSVRGFAYHAKGDNDRAIADLNEALRFKPNDAEVHLSLGVVWSKKGDHERAIAYFNEAINLRPKDARMYIHRGVTYDEKGDFEQAIDDFSMAINLEPTNSIAYHNRGLSYSHRGRTYAQQGMTSNALECFDKAIHDCSKAIELNLKKASTYSNRGVAYIEKENYDLALNDFVSADECDQNLKIYAPGIYIASQIAAIYKGANQEADKVKAFKFYSMLFKAIDAVKINRFFPPKSEVAHYTSLHTLKSVADQGRFRLYNTAYMNDPEEGRAFFEIMKNLPEIDINIEGSFYQDSQLHPSPAYIGSFVINENKRESKDELFLWRTYGKHDGREAAGACLIFKHEGTVFAEKCSLQTGAMEQLQSELLMSTSDLQNPEGRQPRKPDLFEIVYSEEETNQGLSEELKKLAESLKQIKEHIEKEEDVGKKRELKKLARDLLDTIRFLFKARHYREEKEVRVVQIRYYDEEKTTQGPDNIQVDTEHVPHRFYLETHENFRFSEVILGPNARDIPEWKRWLKEHDIKAEQSNIPYGKPYS